MPIPPEYNEAPYASTAHMLSVARQENLDLKSRVAVLEAALKDIMAQCQKWAPTIDRQRGRDALKP